MAYSSPQKVVLIGKESTWATAVTTDKDIGVVQDITDSSTREVDQITGLGGIETQQITTGSAEGAVSTTVKVQNGRLFEYILGSVSHAETTGDWKHTFSISNTPPSATIETAEDGATTDTTRKYDGMLVEKAELKVDEATGLTMKADWKGRVFTSSASTSAAVISSLIVFSKGLVDVKINGTSATQVQEASIIFNKKVELVHGVKNVQPQDGKATELMFEFSAKLGFDNKTFQEIFLGGGAAATTLQITPTAFEFEFNATNGTVLGSGRREIACILENCQDTKNDTAVTIGDMIFLEIGGHGTLKANSCFSVDNISNTNFS